MVTNDHRMPLDPPPSFPRRPPPRCGVTWQLWKMVSRPPDSPTCVHADKDPHRTGHVAVWFPALQARRTVLDGSTGNQDLPHSSSVQHAADSYRCRHSLHDQRMRYQQRPACPSPDPRTPPSRWCRAVSGQPRQLLDAGHGASFHEATGYRTAGSCHRATTSSRPWPAGWLDSGSRPAPGLEQ
ncbi:hypothetical protein D3C77_511810 [compost metagenome]